MGWGHALEVAHSVAPAAQWRKELSRELRRAADASFATVITCRPGDWMRMLHDCDPPGLAALVQRIQSEFVPRIERAGENWRFAIRQHGEVYTPIESARDRALARDLHEAVLSPAGIDGYVVGFFLAGGEIVGLTAIGAPDPSSALLARAEKPLQEVARAAAGTLSSVLAMAEGCGVIARRSPNLYRLTGREGQVAALAAEGYSNVNVAARLGISELTVAVHLRRIYAKLGVHSRVELAAALS